MGLKNQNYRVIFFLFFSARCMSPYVMIDVVAAVALRRIQITTVIIVIGSIPLYQSPALLSTVKFR